MIYTKDLLKQYSELKAELKKIKFNPMTKYFIQKELSKIESMLNRY